MNDALAPGTVLGVRDRSIDRRRGEGDSRTMARIPGNATVWDSLGDGRLIIAQTDDRAAMASRLPGSITDRDLSWLDASWAADISRDGSQVLFTESGRGGGMNGSVYLRGLDGASAGRLGLQTCTWCRPDPVSRGVLRETDRCSSTVEYWPDSHS